MKLPRATRFVGASWISIAALLFGPSEAFSRPFEQSPREEAKSRPESAKAAAEEVDAKQQALRTWAKGLTPTIIEVLGHKRGTAPFRTAAVAQAEIGNREEALAILRAGARILQGEESDPKPRVKGVSAEAFSEGYMLYARIQAILGDEPAALETLRLALKVKFSTPPVLSRFSTLSRVAVEFVKLEAVDDADSVVKEVERQIEAIQDVEDKRKFLPCLAGVYVAAGDVDGAFAILERAEKDARGDDTNKFLDWILSPFNFADDSITKKVVDRMLPRVEDVRSKANGSRSINLLAVNLAKLRDFPKALELARGIDTREDDPKRDSFLLQRSRALISIAKYQNLAGDAEGARNALKEAYESDKLIKAQEGVFGRQSALLRLPFEMMQVNDFTASLRCIEDMKAGQRYGFLSSVGTYQKAAGDEEWAKATFERALEDTEFILPDLVGVAEQDDIAKVRTQFRRIAQRATILAQMGNVEEALTLLNAIAEPNRHQGFLAMVAEAQAEVGDADAALAWIRKQPEALIPELSIAVLKGMGYHAELLRTTKGLPPLFSFP